MRPKTGTTAVSVFSAKRLMVMVEGLNLMGHRQQWKSDPLDAPH